MTTPTRVLQVGAHGYGRVHLDNIAALTERGLVRLVGLCDPVPPAPETLAAFDGVAVSSELDALLTEHRPDITIVATPIHTHLPLAVTALRAGSHVLLEKPPTPTLADFETLLKVSEETDRRCQIGFQSLGSSALAEAVDLVDSGTIGTLLGIGAAGTWIRDTAYYQRAPWAGRMVLDGRPVTDGALTNAFAHAVASALRLGGAERAGDVRRVELERFHAHPIEGDDTACVRLTRADGLPIVVAVTVCAERTRDPYLVLHGESGRITVWYTRDQLLVETGSAFPGTRPVTDDAQSRARALPRTNLLANLVDHLADPSVPLLSPAEGSHTFMRAMEEIRLDGPARAVDPRYYREEGAGERWRPIIDGVDAVVARSAAELRLFSELGAPWAVGTPRDTALPALRDVPAPS
ncbi:Gfo/Idh/MocA family protein [Actinoalloteichus spitiensis]|uniref:Gfo/Idh/MocA family protein n=1 Tax=Actinoalloteichus spitiensis TaxID=252394 RepID=UPI000367D875|nr:Gfo/Idh/MocA family oxidoreductase [Actinoalloteichus spitiensis]